MSAPARKTVELFYDVVSPYSWVAFEVLCRYQTRWNIDLKLRPFFLGGIMQATGNKPPMLVPAKGVYMQTDMQRLRDHFQIPIKGISDPFSTMITKGTIKSQRFLVAVDSKHPEYVEKLSRELWLRIWNKDQDITLPESLTAAALAAGMSESSIKEALTDMEQKPVKDRLKEATDEAIKHGSFGAPTIVAHINGKPEMFWGADRFHLLADLLGEKYEGPLRELAASKL